MNKLLQQVKVNLRKRRKSIRMQKQVKYLKKRLRYVSYTHLDVYKRQIVYDEKVTTMMASCRQRLRWAQGQFDCAGRYIPKLFAIGIKTGNIMILDGIFQVSQPYFLLLTTVYLVLSYINAYTLSLIHI